MKKILVTCLLLFSISFVAGFKGCAKKDAIREAAKASYRLPGSTNDLIDAIKTGVSKGVFTPAQARQFGDILEPITQAEITLVQLVRAANAVYQKTGSIPADQMSRIRILFDEQIVRPFARILEQYKILSPESSAILQTAIAAVRLLLNTVGTGFGSTLLNLISESDPEPGPGTPRKGKKGIVTAGLFGSVRPIDFYPQMRTA
jgi:hypothetical protein